MEINVRHDRKIVAIWLSKAERDDPRLKTKLLANYIKYKQQKYMDAVFESGERDMYQNTRDLLAYNMKRCAEMAVQRAKMLRATVGME